VKKTSDIEIRKQVCIAPEDRIDRMPEDRLAVRQKQTCRAPEDRSAERQNTGPRSAEERPTERQTGLQRDSRLYSRAPDDRSTESGNTGLQRLADLQSVRRQVCGLTEERPHIAPEAGLHCKAGPHRIGIHNTSQGINIYILRI
jgi:hypothetical protein